MVRVFFDLLSNTPAYVQKYVWDERYEIMARVDGCWIWVMGTCRFTYHFIFMFKNFYNKIFFQKTEGVPLGPDKAALNWEKLI